MNLKIFNPRNFHAKTHVSTCSTLALASLRLCPDAQSIIPTTLIIPLRRRNREQVGPTITPDVTTATEIKELGDSQFPCTRKLLLYSSNPYLLINMVATHHRLERVGLVLHCRTLCRASLRVCYYLCYYYA